MSIVCRLWLEVGNLSLGSSHRAPKPSRSFLTQPGYALRTNLHSREMCLKRGLSAQGICFLSQRWKEFKGQANRDLHPSYPPPPHCVLLENTGLGSSVTDITMSIIFCLPYWDSFAFYLIISTTEPALTLSFQNHLRILFLDHFLESQTQGDLTRHFAGVSVILLSDGPSFLLVSTSFKNVYLPRSSICWWHLLLRIQRIKLIPLPVTSGISQDGPSCAVVTSNPLGGSAQGAFLIYKSYVGCLSGLCSSESLSNTVWWKFYRDTCFHKHHNWIRSIQAVDLQRSMTGSGVLAPTTYFLQANYFISLRFYLLSIKWGSWESTYLADLLWD